MRTIGFPGNIFHIYKKTNIEVMVAITAAAAIGRKSRTASLEDGRKDKGNLRDFGIVARRELFFVLLPEACFSCEKDRNTPSKDVNQTITTTPTIGDVCGG